ncbi:MAG: HAD hydrolase-like protein [Alphaproteobacteria bacterium]|nr:HAD hydrolase-like protein [Alphaproteobacteria bacterium]
MINAQNILFDLDGTISDPKEGITKSIAYALEELDHTPPPLEELTVYIGPPLKNAFEEMLGSSAQAEKALSLYRYRYNEQGRGMIENILYPAIPETLAALKQQGKQLFIATSKAVDIAEKVVGHFGLSDLFVKVYGAEIDGTRSDKAELIAYILACENITPKDAVMIGDRKHDIIGAVKNGIRAIGVLWGYGSAEELREAGACALCESPQGLLREL